MIVLTFLIGFFFGVASAALFAEFVNGVETRVPKIPNCPHVPPPPRPTPDQVSMSDYL